MKWRIEYSHVCFGYSANKSVFESLSFSIYPGEIVAFQGSSGVGKTTICSLLPRFYDVLGGTIKVDDIDIRDMTLHVLRKNIGIVQQDVFLFAGTIRENIAYGRLNAFEAQIIEAARRTVGGCDCSTSFWS